MDDFLNRVVWTVLDRDDYEPGGRVPNQAAFVMRSSGDRLYVEVNGDAILMTYTQRRVSHRGASYTVTESRETCYEGNVANAGSWLELVVMPLTLTSEPE